MTSFLFWWWITILTSKQCHSTTFIISSDNFFWLQSIKNTMNLNINTAHDSYVVIWKYIQSSSAPQNLKWRRYEWVFFTDVLFYNWIAFPILLCYYVTPTKDVTQYWVLSYKSNRHLAVMFKNKFWILARTFFKSNFLFQILPTRFSCWNDR